MRSKNVAIKTKQKQAMRFNTGKPQLSYLLDFPNAVASFARVCETGAAKYARHNWKKGLPVTQCEDSLLRHLEKFHNCEDQDVESKQLHLAHVAWNAMAMIETLSRYGHGPGTLFDNRDFENEEGREDA